MIRLASVNYAKPLQEDGELTQLAQLLAAKGVKRYLEVGARYGGSFEVIMRALPKGARGVAIDLPGGNFGDPHSGLILHATADRLRQEGYEVSVLFGDSGSELTWRRALKCGPFDAVLIDADHAYAAVKRDFEIYRNFAPIVVLHDIAAPAYVTSRTGLPVEVPVFWNEVKQDFAHEQIIVPGSVMGIGVLYTDRPKFQQAPDWGSAANLAEAVS